MKFQEIELKVIVNALANYSNDLMEQYEDYQEEAENKQTCSKPDLASGLATVYEVNVINRLLRRIFRSLPDSEQKRTSLSLCLAVIKGTNDAIARFEKTIETNEGQEARR